MNGSDDGLASPGDELSEPEGTEGCAGATDADVADVAVEGGPIGEGDGTTMV